jgi:hypothetical protein
MTWFRHQMPGWTWIEAAEAEQALSGAISSILT